MSRDELTPTLRSWLRDPDGFARRLQERAETLFADGYRVQVYDDGQPGLYFVYTFTPGHVQQDSGYIVNALNETCSCQYFQKREIPDLPHCKHLRGLLPLIENELAFLQTAAQQHALAGHTDRADERWRHFSRLQDHWQVTLDAVADREAQRQDDNDEGRQTIEADAVDTDLRVYHAI